MQEIIVPNYINKQIAIEEDYYDKLSDRYEPLILALLDSFESGKGKYNTLANKYPWERNIYPQITSNDNPDAVSSINKLVQKDILAVDNKLDLNYFQSVQTLADFNINTQNLTNVIVGIILTAIPVGANSVESKYRETNSDELITRCNNAIKRNVQISVSQAVANEIVSSALAYGYTEYLPDNEHDDRVRELHKIENSGTIWYPLNNPPSSGYPGTDYGCRCRFSRFR